ncbi:hypothetical protein BGZ65_000831, partial [Modicella reniformis]
MEFTFGEQDVEDIDDDVVSMGQNKTSPRTSISDDHTIPSTSLARLTLVRPSKRRQESDLTADIEATVMALDIDKDPAKPDSMQDTTMDADHSSDRDHRKAKDATYPL